MVRVPLVAAALAALAAYHVVSAAPTDLDSSSQTDTTAAASALPPKDCSFLINAGLGSIVVQPSDPAYAAREASYWAPNAALGPLCIVLPKNAADVSKVIKAVKKACAKFAVRSGGHVQWAGGSDVKGGVTIDLSSMTAITYNTQTTIASLQPGPRWRDVFAALRPYGVAPTGGRDADVGIGGFLTGGGNAYLTGRNGFGCDTVVNHEVVLADGTIVNANKTSNSDLWKALKGGWANFGIVTRFDIETTPSPSVWGGSNIHDYKYVDQVAVNLVDFTNQNTKYRADAHLVLATYNTVAPKNFGLITVEVDTENVPHAPAFAAIEKVPALIATANYTTLGDLATTGVDPSDDRVHWFTLTFNNDISIVRQSIKLHEQMVAKLNSSMGGDGFSTQNVLQPIPSYFGEVGASKGGNVLGLDSVKTNSILWLGTVAYTDPAHDKIAHDAIQAYATSLESYAKSKNGNVAWRYINYSDKTQNPLKSYGQANINFMKTVAAKYDPSGVFQTQMPGSFKISAI